MFEKLKWSSVYERAWIIRGSLFSRISEGVYWWAAKHWHWILQCNSQYIYVIQEMQKWYKYPETVLTSESDFIGFHINYIIKNIAKLPPFLTLILKCSNEIIRNFKSTETIVGFHLISFELSHKTRMTFSSYFIQTCKSEMKLKCL